MRWLQVTGLAHAAVGDGAADRSIGKGRGVRLMKGEGQFLFILAAAMVVAVVVYVASVEGFGFADLACWLELVCHY